MLAQGGMTCKKAKRAIEVTLPQQFFKQNQHTCDTIVNDRHQQFFNSDFNQQEHNES